MYNGNSVRFTGNAI
jgi:hypothetical protein